MSNSPSYQRLFAELKRRHVFKVAAVYGAGAFVALQVADLLQQGLQLPQAVLTTATIGALIGFPVALVEAMGAGLDDRQVVELADRVLAALDGSQHVYRPVDRVAVLRAARARLRLIDERGLVVVQRDRLRRLLGGDDPHLEHVDLVQSVGLTDADLALPPDLGATKSWQMPFSVRRAAATFALKGTPLPADWAIAWVRCDPEIRL